MRSRWFGVRPAAWCAAAASLVALTGCGDQSRPVVTPSSPSSPAAQVSSYAVAVTAPTANASGSAILVDYSGDTVSARQTIGADSSVAVRGFTIDPAGAVGYTINSNGTLSNFPLTTSLGVSGSVSYSTLPSQANITGMFSPSSALWLADTNTSINRVDVLSSSPATLQLTVPVTFAPTALIGVPSSGARYYSISSGNGYNDMTCNTSPTAGASGLANAIETGTHTISATIALGSCPVYSVASSDGKRIFVLNRGSSTITVINAQTNSLNDSCATGCKNQSNQTYYGHPTITLPSGSGPVYAEYVAATSQLVVANYDNGTVSVIDVSLDTYGNDSATFGTQHTITLSSSSNPRPVSVTALADGGRAYVANQVGTLDTTGNNGDVTILNLASYTIEKTLAVTGHPRSIASTQNSLYGKVYVSAPDSAYLTIIRTDTDTVTASLAVSSHILDVRTTTKDGTSSSNANTTSWMPGMGRPCNLPDTSSVTRSSSYATCVAIP